MYSALAIFSRRSCWKPRLPMLLALLLTSLSSAADQATNAIRFAPEKDYGPFVFEDTEGTVRGLSMDMLDALRPMLSWPVTTLPAQSLAGILEAARLGQVDLISSLRLTGERSVYLDFTAPYVQVPTVLVVRQSVSPAQLSNLAGKRVAVGKDFAVEAFVRNAYPRVHWQAVPDDASALRGLLAGKYQAVVADIASVSFVIRTHRLRGLQLAQTIGFDYPLSFAYRRELVDFGQHLQAAMLELDSQQRQQIVDRWIDKDALRFENPHRTLTRWIGLGLAAFASGILLFARLRSRSAAQA